MRQWCLFPPEIVWENGRLRGPLPPVTPIIVSNGVGVDSVALLIELRRQEIRPDAIITALVGRERVLVPPWGGKPGEGVFDV